MGVTDSFKKWKRSLDVYMTYKRSFLFLLLFCVLFFYISPLFYSSHFEDSNDFDGTVPKCSEEHIFHPHYDLGNKDFVFDSHKENGGKYLPFVGNGEFGVSFYPKPALFLKDKRTLSLSTQYNPIISIGHENILIDKYITNTFSGTVHRYQCLDNGVFVTSTYFAHRTNPYLFYQDVVVTNPTDHDKTVNFQQNNFPEWSVLSKISRNVDGKTDELPIRNFIGILKNVTIEDNIAVCLQVTRETRAFKVSPHRSKHFTFTTVIYKERMSPSYFTSNKLPFEQKCKSVRSKASIISLKQEHSNAWQKLWDTGLSISHSKVSSALNNDQINATLYYVLSNVPTNMSKTSLKPARNSTSGYISLAEGCYGGYHHTLQALGLWKGLHSFKDVNEIVSLWLLTLEKQGCHNLLISGAEEALQAMVLSFGGFHFSPHHLEFKIDPKVLHRDYYFRKIKLDYITYINVSVILQKDNKARIGVSLNRNDITYYACAGGCIDIVTLSTSEVDLPVIITEPITSILYITSDKSHMELIKDTLHVHKIVEAPAHDHHVVALHKHGSHLGGLPLMFWISVIALIVVFHLFLCKLIINEYCGKQEKIKTRYARV